MYPCTMYLQITHTTILTLLANNHRTVKFQLKLIVILINISLLIFLHKTVLCFLRY